MTPPLPSSVRQIGIGSHMNDTEKMLRPHAKPWLGWLCVKPIPKVEGDDRNMAHPSIIMGMMGMMMAPGVESGIVIEVGGYEGDTEFSASDVIYWRDSGGLEIGDYTYLLINSVVAWEPCSTTT